MNKYIMLSLFLLLPFKVFGSDAFVAIINTSAALNDDSQLNGKDVLKIKAQHFGNIYPILNQTATTYEVEIDGTRGWLSGRNVKKTRAATGMFYAKEEEDTKLKRKAFVVNLLKSKDFPQKIPLFGNPSLSGEPLGFTTIFELRYIYEESNNAVLLGRLERFRAPSSKKSSIDYFSGWVGKKHIVEWNNRIGIEFNKKNYHEREERAKIYDVEKIGQSKLPMFTEENDASPLPYYVNRFPVLKQVHLGDEEKQYKIAYIGGSQIGGKSYTQQQIDLEKEKLAKLAKRTKLQIAILVDATKGMQPQMESVKEALKRYIRNVKKEGENLEIEIAIAAYRDWADGADVFTIYSAFTKDLDRVYNAINSIDAKSSGKDSGKGAFPEAVYQGIYKTINDLSWDNDAARSIVMLGDHGNHDDASQYPQESEYSKSGVKEKLESEMISLFVVQIINVQNSSRREVEDRFYSQMRYVFGENNIYGKMLKATGDPDDIGMSEKEIYNALEQTYKTFFTERETLLSVRQGEERENTSTQEVDLSQIYKGKFTQMVLDRYGINPEIFKAVQVCAVGYTNRTNKDGQQQIVEKVLTEKATIYNLRTLLHTLISNIHERENKAQEGIRKAIAQSVEALAGERPDSDELISDFIEKKTGLPVQTPLLTMSIDDLVKMIVEDRDRSEELAKYLGKIKVRVSEVTDEMKYNITEWQEHKGDYAYDYGEPVQYFFSLEHPLLERIKNKDSVIASDKTHVWMPLDYLP
jgi:hypothetical protein